MIFFCNDFYVYVFGKSGSSGFVFCFVHPKNKISTYRYIYKNLTRIESLYISIYIYIYVYIWWHHPSAHLSFPPILTWCICRLDQASHRSFKQPTRCSRRFANIHGRPHLWNRSPETTLVGTVLRSTRRRVLKEAMWNCCLDFSWISCTMMKRIR